jgi:two-component system, chemotaxis family, protein-glutamate methylesterase/glutaminase
MAIRVLVVDDSFFFCQMVGKLLNRESDIEVIGFANTGMEAIEKAVSLKPDIITLDVEMPIMDGITALREIKSKTPNVSVLMFSSLTYEGAKLTLDALSFGAVDFLLKSYEDVSNVNSRTARVLIEKVRMIAKQMGISEKKTISQPPTTAPRVNEKSPKRTALSSSDTVIPAGQIKLVAIGSSTGGPVALQTILKELPRQFPVPIVIAQHMPEAFTGAFAERLNSLCELQVEEVKPQTRLQKGHVYIAPGGKQLMLEGRADNARFKIIDSERKLTYQPSVDVTFGSAAKVFGNGVLALVLTGMGADGREGARLLKNKGSFVWAQDESSCVIYGMPMAVVKAGLADRELRLEMFARQLVKAVC